MTSRQSILLLEDEVDIFSILKGLLDKLGAPRVFTATNSEDAVVLLNDRHIDLIIIDIKTIPEKGIQFINELHKRDSQLKIIIVAVHGTPSLREQTVAAGAGYIEKPFNIKEFTTLVQQYLPPQGFNGAGVRGIHLFDLFQLIEKNNKSLLLIVTNNHEDVGKLYFDKGAVIHAATKQKIGKEAFYEVMKWEQGNITSLQLPMKFPTTISDPTSVLIMSAMHIKDEIENNPAPSLQGSADHPDTIKKPAGSLDTPKEPVAKTTLTGTSVPSQPTISKEIIMTLQQIQEQFKSEIQGFISSVVADTEQSLLLAGTSTDPSFDASVPVGFFNEVVRAANSALEVTGWGAPEDMLISGKDYNIVIFLLKDGTYWQGISISKATPVGMALARFRAIKKELEAALP